MAAGLAEACRHDHAPHSPDGRGAAARPYSLPSSDDNGTVYARRDGAADDPTIEVRPIKDTPSSKALPWSDPVAGSSPLDAEVNGAGNQLLFVWKHQDEGSEFYEPTLGIAIPGQANPNRTFGLLDVPRASFYRYWLLVSSGDDESEAPERGVETAVAAVRAGDPQVLDLIGAAAQADDPTVAGAALALEAILHAGIDDTGMVTTARRLEALIARVDAPHLRAHLRAQLYNAVLVDTRLSAERRRLLLEIDAEPADVLLPILAYEAAGGDATAGEVVARAESALASAPLRDLATVEASTPFLSVMAQLTVEGADLADTALREAEAVARRGALPPRRKTVEYTLGRAFAKLDVKSRTQLAGRFD